MSIRDSTIELPDIPEIETLRQFEACARRIVASLPEKRQTRYTITLEGGAFTMAMALKELFQDADPRYPTPSDHILHERDFGRRGLLLARRMLWRLKDSGRGNQVDVNVALELLERVEPAFWREDIPAGRYTVMLDMFSACSHASDMPVMLQVRNVPDSLHRKLKARAALEGVSLSDYVLRELERVASYPTRDEMKARLASLPPVDMTGVDAAELIREGREERERQMDEWS